MPPYRASQCNHICLLWGGPNWVYCHASRRCLHRGKVMRERYLGWVGQHKPYVPKLFARFVPVWDRFCLPRRWSFAFGRLGLPGLNPKSCVGRSGRESVMAVDRFCRNAVGPPKWECEAMGSMVWVKCATSAESVFV